MTKNELAIWIEKFGKDIYSFCMHLTNNSIEADELYQDTWLSLMNNLAQVDTENNVKSYCLSVAIGLWNNKKRKFAWRARIAPQVQYESDEGEIYIAGTVSSPEDDMIDLQTKQAVWNAVDKLPEKLRVLIVLYYMEQLSFEQISSIVKIPKGTVKSRLYKARKLLEKELGDLYE